MARLLLRVGTKTALLQRSEPKLDVTAPESVVVYHNEELVRLEFLGSARSTKFHKSVDSPHRHVGLMRLALLKKGALDQHGLF